MIAAVVGGGGPSSSFLQAVAKAAIANAITQGIGVAVGLQKKFDWAGVAAAGIGGGIGQQPQDVEFLSNGSRLGRAANNAIVVTARDLAGAAARTLISGTDFGDNVIAALPDALGQSIGGYVGDGTSSNCLISQTGQRAFDLSIRSSHQLLMKGGGSNCE